MKSACVVFKKNKNDLLSSDFFSVADTFCSQGYAFEEIRILFLSNETETVQALAQLNGYDTLVLLSKSSDFSSVKNIITAAFPQGIYQGGINGAGIYESQEKAWFLLASDCVEAGKEYVKKVCVPFIRKKYGLRHEKYSIRAVGANAAHVQRLLEEAKYIAKDKIIFAHKSKYGEDIIELFYDEKTPKMLLDDVARLFADGLRESVYALEDVTLEEQLVRLLKLRNKKISVAESFTGGGIGSRIVSVPGASEVYFEGLNTYNENAKIKRLGVSQFALKTKGAVSDQTAYEMASGLIASGDCDVAVATTGLAGPKSDNSLLPVGLCYIAVGVKERVYVYRYQFEGSRDEITQTAIRYALFLAYKQLENI